MRGVKNLVGFMEWPCERCDCLVVIAAVTSPPDSVCAAVGKNFVHHVEALEDAIPAQSRHRNIDWEVSPQRTGLA